MNTRKIVESRPFERFIVFVICINAIILGLETLEFVQGTLQSVLKTIDVICLVIFTIEIVLKLIVYRVSFFRDPWRIFDFFVVGISLLPTSGPFSIVRSLRVLRGLRMVSIVPELRKVVTGLLSALPGLGAVTSILLLVFYVSSVIATKLFASDFPQWFGSIAESAYTLFQIMTLESWSMGIVRPVMERFPLSWIFFLPFILVTTFTMLNLFIAVIVNAMQSETEQAAEYRAQEGHDERIQLLEEIKTIKKSLDELRHQIDSKI